MRSLDGFEHGKTTEEGENDEAVSEELAVLDRSGRVQLPREYLDTLGIKGGSKVKVELSEDKDSIVVFRSG